MAEGKAPTSPEPPVIRSNGSMALGAFHLLHSVGGSLLTQATLHAQLAGIEWAQERSRLLKMVLVMLLGFASLLCSLLFAGALIVVLTWDTVYRIASVLGVLLAYGVSTGIAWRRFMSLSAQGEHSFAATREQLSADIDLFRSER